MVQLLLPVIFTILGLAALEGAPDGADDPALTFNINPFEDPIIPYYVGASPSSDATKFGNLYSSYFNGPVDVGVSLLFQNFH